MQTVNIDLFKNATAFSMSMHFWGATSKVNPNKFKDKISEDAMKRALKVSKILIICDQYDAIRTHLSETRSVILKRYVVPSFFKRGIDIVKLPVVEQVEAYLNQRLNELPPLVAELQKVYPLAKAGAYKRLTEAATNILGVPDVSFYDEEDYPNVNDLPRLFNIKWNWIAFGIPDQLPKEVFEAEKNRVEKIWQDAQEQITLSLRTGWQELVDHMVDRLTVQPGEKPKVFRDSLVENMAEFISAFNNRNINNDSDLQSLIEKARVVMMGVDAEGLRKDPNARESILSSMREIKAATDGLLTTVPSRKFNFDAE